MSQLSPSTFEFLTELSANNNREWFTENKSRYQEAHSNVASFFETLITEMNKVDQIETESAKKAMFRIYRDVRFSKNKSPYKTSLSGALSRATKWLRGGYYVHLEPGNGFLGVGFWQPESKDLKLIRDDIAHDATKLRAIINDPDFKAQWGELRGEQLKTAPKGFDKDHPNVDLLRFKAFTFAKSFTEEEACSEDFIFHVVSSFLSIRPFFDYMSEVLTAHLED